MCIRDRYKDRASVEEVEPPGLVAASAGSVGGVQQRLGEVPAPDDNGLGQGAKQDDMQKQPASVIDPVMGDRDPQPCQQPGNQRVVAHGPTAAGGLLLRMRHRFRGYDRQALGVKYSQTCLLY